MRVKMLQDAPGSPDGITVQDYTEGVEYDVPDRLGDVFVHYELATAVGEDGETVIIDLPKLGTGPTADKQDAGPTENK
jgi:hypothetical protein